MNWLALLVLITLVMGLSILIVWALVVVPVWPSVVPSVTVWSSIILSIVLIISVVPATWTELVVFCLLVSFGSLLVFFFVLAQLSIVSLML